MANRAERLGKRLEAVGNNITVLSSNPEFGKIVGWLFSIEASLRECVKDFSEFTKLKEYRKLPPNILNRPTVSNRLRRNWTKYPNANYLYADEIDNATLGRLVIYYSLLRPTNRKLRRKLEALTDGRNKIVHKLFRSKNIQADFGKIFPRYIRNKPMKDIFDDIINDIGYVLSEIKKIS